MMHGDVRGSDPGRDAAAFPDLWAAAEGSELAGRVARTRSGPGWPACAAAFWWPSPWSPGAWSRSCLC